MKYHHNINKMEINKDKALEYINDVTDYEETSECCDAPGISNFICSECKEHCKQ